MRVFLPLLLVVWLGAGCASSEAESTPSQQRNGLIAYTHQHESKLDQIFALRADGAAQRALTKAGANALDPVWSPDGKRIAFIGGKDGSMFVMNADGTERQLLVRGKDPVGSAGRPSWSPDGRRLVFVGAQITTDNLYTVRSDGSGLRRLAGDIGSEPAWSPDGEQIALASSLGQLILIDLEGETENTVTGEGTCIDWPTWSPDGSRIAYVDSGPDCWGDSSHLRVVDVGGENDEALTHPPADTYDESPAWSPDGRKIAFQRGDIAMGDIYVLDLDSGEATQITHSRTHTDFDPSWQPLP